MKTPQRIKILPFVCFIFICVAFIVCRIYKKDLITLHIFNRNGTKSTKWIMTGKNFSEPEFYDVVLSAYKHSGSTVTGRILGKRRDAFYIYEPLWQATRRGFYKGPHMLCHDAHKECVNLTEELLTRNKLAYTRADRDKRIRIGAVLKGTKGSLHSLNESLNYLQSIFHCSFHRYPHYFTKTGSKKIQKADHGMIFFKGKSWENFKKCVESKAASLESCLKAVEPKCRSAKYRVIKLLRMSLDNMAPLLQSNNRLKVVHLFRDPRGIQNSLWDDIPMPKRDKEFQDIRNRVETLCHRLLWDLNASTEMKKLFPDRVKIIQYETLGNLTDVARDLYAFLGMSYTEEHQPMLQQIATEKGSKGFHPFNYRTRLPWSIVSLFETHCSEVLDQLGYARYTSESHLKNMSESGFGIGKRIPTLDRS